MEELDIALARLIEQATTGIDASVGFLQAELPDVVAQLLTWNFVISAIGFLVGMVLAVVSLVAIYKRLTWEEEIIKKYEDGSEGEVVDAFLNECKKSNHFEASYHARKLANCVSERGGIVSGVEVPNYLFFVAILTGVPAATLLIFNFAWLQIWIAPKVWLLEYAAKLVS